MINFVFMFFYMSHKSPHPFDDKTQKSESNSESE